MFKVDFYLQPTLVKSVLDEIVGYNVSLPKTNFYNVSLKKTDLIRSVLSKTDFTHIGFIKIDSQCCEKPVTSTGHNEYRMVLNLKPTL